MNVDTYVYLIDTTRHTNMYVAIVATNIKIYFLVCILLCLYGRVGTDYL